MSQRPTPNRSHALAWAREHESGAGEEHERTLDLAEPGGDNCVQTWAEYVYETRSAFVGFWARTHGTEVRWDLTPDQARELAANLIVLADDAATTGDPDEADDAASSTAVES